MLIVLVDETQSLVRVVLSYNASAASQWFHGLFSATQDSAGSLSAELMPVMAARS